MKEKTCRHRASLYARQCEECAPEGAPGPFHRTRESGWLFVVGDFVPDSERILAFLGRREYRRIITSGRQTRPGDIGVRIVTRKGTMNFNGRSFETSWKEFQGVEVVVLVGLEPEGDEWPEQLLRVVRNDHFRSVRRILAGK
jgi:hypothetical protein